MVQLKFKKCWRHLLAWLPVLTFVFLRLNVPLMEDRWNSRTSAFFSPDVAGLFSLGKRRQRRDQISAYKYLKGRCQVDWANFFSALPSERIRGNEHKMSHTNMRKTIFETDTGTGCPEGLWSLLFWRYSISTWILFCVTLLQGTCFSWGVGPDDLQTSLVTLLILWL